MVSTRGDVKVGGGPRLTIRDRILLHLAEFSSGKPSPQVPPQLSQPGIVEAVGIRWSHLPQNIRPMITAGFVVERLERVHGSKQRRKTYFLTPQGRIEAMRLRANVLATVVEVEEAGDRRTTPLVDATKGPLKGVPLLTLLKALDAQGCLRLPAPGPRGASFHQGDAHVEKILHEARQKEAVFDWLGAANDYQRALDLGLKGDPPGMADTHERQAYALFRSAFQAEAVHEFRERVVKAADTYRTAMGVYGRLGEAAQAKSVKCGAMVAYLGFWLADGAANKRRLTEEAWRLTKEALKAFRADGDSLGYGGTYIQLGPVAWLTSEFQWEGASRMEIWRQAVGHGEQAITLLSGSGDPLALATVHIRTAGCLEQLLYFHEGMDERLKLHRKAMDYWTAAVGLSLEAALLESSWVTECLWADGSDEAIANLERALEYARKRRDRFFIGRAMDLLAHHTVWRVFRTEELEDKSNLFDKALRYAEGAAKEYSIIGFVSSRPTPYNVGMPHAEHHWSQTWHEVDLNKKRRLLERATEALPDELRRARESGYPGLMCSMLGIGSKILTSAAGMETDAEERSKLLKMALEYVNEAIEIVEKIETSAYRQGLYLTWLADLKFELANEGKDRNTNIGLLREAALDKEIGLEMMAEDLAFYGIKGEVVSITTRAIIESDLGELLTRLHEMTGETEFLEKAARAFEDAARSFGKPDIASRVAECFWRAARILDSLEEHLKSAEDFRLASDGYRAAAKRIPQLQNLYEDHALYMQAWAEIERARHHHTRQDYGQAKEYYERAATLQGFTKNWDFLAPYYLAWARLEAAEDLSRKEQEGEAIQAFEEAAKLLGSAKLSFESLAGKQQIPDESQMSTELIKAADIRKQYCSARIHVEKARILDKRGEQAASSEEYGLAAETLEGMVQGLESEGERREITLITTLSRAWQAMVKAEAEASPEGFGKASQLFEKAKNFAPNERMRLLALGHSHFCEALEAGSRFTETAEASFHASAAQHLEIAGKYYVKAGFQSASEYAKASKLVFEAHALMNSAGKETDQERRARIYIMVERVLQLAAASYARAGHPGRMEEVLRLIDQVREEQELAISLTEILRAPSVVSTTTAFSTPRPTHESALGVERFEHADVRMALTVRVRKLRVGENLSLEMELINAGRGVAQLIKVEDLTPKYFEIVQLPKTYRIQDQCLDMKGRRLEPLKVEEMAFVLKPLARGLFVLRPRVLYMGEDGKHRWSEPQPLEISVEQ